MTEFSADDAWAAFWVLMAVYWGSEMLFLVRMRAGNEDRADDRGSSRVLAILFTLAWFAAWALSAIARFSFSTPAVIRIGLLLMTLALLLRWWSIATLGRLFTVNVAIRTEHRLIDDGPYRLVRHPAYTAILLFHFGAALCLGNLLSLIALMLPAFLALLNRMRVEENVLLENFGDSYRQYMKRTKRLIPAIY